MADPRAMVFADLSAEIGKYIFRRARPNQANSGINYSSVYPLQGKVKGALLYNFFQYDGISKQQHAFMRKYTKLVSGALG